MIWLQSGVSFVLWICYGIRMRGRESQLRTAIERIPRASRVGRSALWLIGGAVLLLAGLIGLGAAGAIQRGALTGWGWAAVTLLGLLFVHCQVVGAGLMVSLARPGTSEGSE